MAKDDKEKTKKKPEAEASEKKAKPEGKKLQTKGKGEKKAKAPRAGATPPSAKRPTRVVGTMFARQSENPGKWRLIDATGMTLGRLSSHIATVLMGKDKPTYTPFADTGEHVLVINAAAVKLTGTKWEDKTYHYHTNYPGGIKAVTAREMLEKHPERIIQWAVWGMLPKSKGHMARRWYKKLRVVAGAEHEHTAQQPQNLKLPNLGM